MAMLSFCGIDVSKDRLDVVVLPEGWFFSVSNDTAGWAELVVRVRPLAVSAIGLEPSGGYERGIIRALLAAGLSVRCINPNKLRQFARARSVLAKNDRLDARMIAEYTHREGRETPCLGGSRQTHSALRANSWRARPCVPSGRDGTTSASASAVARQGQQTGAQGDRRKFRPLQFRGAAG
jgi:hypothetical protein